MFDLSNEDRIFKVKNTKIVSATRGRYLQGGSPDDDRDFFAVEIKGVIQELSAQDFNSPSIAEIVQKATEIARSTVDGETALASKFTVKDVEEGDLFCALHANGSVCYEDSFLALDTATLQVFPHHVNAEITLKIIIESSALALIAAAGEALIELRFTPAQTALELEEDDFSEDLNMIPMN